MPKRIGVCLSCLLLTALLACNKSGKNESQPPVGQSPAGQDQPPPTPAAQPAAEAPAQPQSAPGQAQSTPGKPSAPWVMTQPAAPPKAVPVVTPPSEPVAKPTAAAVQSKVNSEPPAVVPAQPQLVTIPSGTRFEIRLVDPISSEVNKPGDTFKASLDVDLQVDGRVVVPRGSAVSGKLLQVKGSGRVEGRAAMSVTLTQITVGEVPQPIQTNTLSFEAEKNVKGDATKVGIGAGIGAIIGAIAGGGKGAAIGAAIGGGAGTATVLATKGKEVKFQPEDRFSFVLNSNLQIRQR